MPQPVQKFRRKFGNPGRLNELKQFIREYWIEHHFSPSSREIAAALGYSTSVIHYYRLRMEHDGWLEVHPASNARSWVPAEIFADRPVFGGASSGKDREQTIKDIVSFVDEEFFETTRNELLDLEAYLRERLNGTPVKETENV